MTIRMDLLRASDPDAFRTAFLGKTATEPRPTAADYPDLHPRQLANAQAGYDLAKADDAKRDAYMAAKQAERDAKASVAQAAQEQRDERMRQQREEQALRPARMAFLSAGGSLAQWDAQKGAVAEQVRANAAVQAASGTPKPATESLVNPSSF